MLLTETVCCFRCCLSVVSVVLVVVFDSFGRVWHLSCVLFWLVSVLLTHQQNQSVLKVKMIVMNGKNMDKYTSCVLIYFYLLFNH
jgi:ubiquitin-protein ligase